MPATIRPPERRTQPLYRRPRGYRKIMTDPNDDLDSVADSGVPGDDENAGEPGRDPGPEPGADPDSPAAQGSPVGPPD
jgi:hypothetical protein